MAANEFPPKSRHAVADDALEQSIADAERNRSFAEPPRRPYDGGPRDRSQYPTDGPTEYSWGPGLVPTGKKHASPERGSMYRGTSPRRGRPTARDYDAPGHPGVQIAT